MKNTYTSEEIVKAFGMKEDTIMRWIEDGNFEGVRFDESKWIFDIDPKWTLDNEPSLSSYSKRLFLHNPSED